MVNITTLKIPGYTYQEDFNNTNTHSYVYISDNSEDDWFELTPDYENEDLVVLTVVKDCVDDKVVVLNMTQFEQELLEKNIISYLS